MKILYNIVSGYQLLSAVLHSIKNKENKTTLVMSEYVYKKFNSNGELEKYFDNIFAFNYKGLNKNSLTLKEDIINHFDNFLVKKKINLEEYDEVLLYCAYTYFGVYIALKGIKFTFVEDASGLLSRPDILMDFAKKRDGKKHFLAQELGLYDSKNDLVVQRICNTKYQQDNFYLDNIVHFDVIDTLNEINTEDFNNVKNTFVGKFTNVLKNNSAIILTQHFFGLGLMSYKEQEETYKLLCDYFLYDKNLVFKRHPEDIMPYREFFEGCEDISTVFMSEFMPYVMKDNNTTICSISSTAYEQVKAYYSDSLFLGSKINCDREILHKVFTALVIVSEIEKEKKRILFNEEDYLIGKEFLKKIPNFKGMKGHTFEKNFLNSGIGIYSEYDEISLEGLLKFSKDDISVILDKRYLYNLYKKIGEELFEILLPIEIKISNKKETRDKSIIIYLLTQNRKIIEKTGDLRMKVELKYLKKELKIEEVNRLEVRNKILEGLLDSAEEKIKQLEVVKDLEKKDVKEI